MIYCLYIIQKVVVLIIDFKRGDAALQTINRSCCIYIIYIYAGLLIRIPCQMPFVLFSSNTTGVINGAGTANSNGVPELVPRFRWVCFAQSLVFCAVLCVFQIVVCTFVPLLLVQCLYFDLWLLITHLDNFIIIIYIHAKYAGTKYRHISKIFIFISYKEI